jgi:hypothetical protein
MFGFDTPLQLVTRLMLQDLDGRILLFFKRHTMTPEYAIRRAEERIPTKVTALLVGGGDRLGMETGLTENVSRRGARIITAKRWQPNETVLLSLPGFRFACAARVTYCDCIERRTL